MEIEDKEAALAALIVLLWLCCLAKICADPGAPPRRGEKEMRTPPALFGLWLLRQFDQLKNKILGEGDEHGVEIEGMPPGMPSPMDLEVVVIRNETNETNDIEVVSSLSGQSR